MGVDATSRESRSDFKSHAGQEEGFGERAGNRYIVCLEGENYLMS